MRIFGTYCQYMVARVFLLQWVRLSKSLSKGPVSHPFDGEKRQIDGHGECLSGPAGKELAALLHGSRL
jgi:hypothetical protein